MRGLPHTASIAHVIEGRARFVEVAAAAPVPLYGHRVPMLLGGPNACASYFRVSVAAKLTSQIGRNGVVPSREYFTGLEIER